MNILVLPPCDHDECPPTHCTHIVLDVPQIQFRPERLIMPQEVFYQLFARSLVSGSNATLETLAKRICYGGRKARRADKRLHAFTRIHNGQVSLRKLLTPYKRGQP